MIDAQSLKQRLTQRRVKSIDLDGEQVFIRSLKRGEVVQATQSSDDNDTIAHRLILMSLCDEAGNRLFSDDEDLDLDIATFVMLSKSVVEFNGLDAEVAEKN